jgi:hypothetical protein
VTKPPAAIRVATKIRERHIEARHAPHSDL